MLSMHAAGDVRPGRRRAVPRRFRHVRAASTSSAAYLQLTARAGHNPQVCRGLRALAHRRVQTRETEVTAGRAELQTRPRGAIRRLARLTDLVVGRAQCGPYLPTQEVPAPEMQSAFVVPQTPAQPPNRAPTHGTLRNISRTRRSEHACRPIRRFLDRSEHRIVRQHSIPHHASGWIRRGSSPRPAADEASTIPAGRVRTPRLLHTTSAHCGTARNALAFAAAPQWCNPFAVVQFYPTGTFRRSNYCRDLGRRHRVAATTRCRGRHRPLSRASRVRDARGLSIGIAVAAVHRRVSASTL